MRKKNHTILAELPRINRICVLLSVLLSALFVSLTPAMALARTTRQLQTAHSSNLVTSTFQGEDLGGVWNNPLSPDSAVSWGPGRIDQFVVGENGQLYHYWLDATPHLESWGGNWAGRDGFNATRPAAVSWGYPRLDVFLIGQNGRLYHYWQNGGSVHHLELLPAASSYFPTNGYVAATTWGSGRLDVFVVGFNGNLYHYWQDHTGGFSWENLGGNFTGGAAPAAVTWGYPRLDVFIANQSGALTHFWQQNTPFQADSILTGHNWVSSTPPSAVSWGPGRLDLFLFGAGGRGNQLYHAWSQDNAAFQAEPLPVSLLSEQTPGCRAVSWGPGRLDVFVNAGSNERTLEHLWQQDGNSFGIEAIDDTIMRFTLVAATTWGPGRLDVFTGYGLNLEGPMHHFWQG